MIIIISMGPNSHIFSPISFVYSHLRSFSIWPRRALPPKRPINVRPDTNERAHNKNIHETNRQLTHSLQKRMQSLQSALRCSSRFVFPPLVHVIGCLRHPVGSGFGEPCSIDISCVCVVGWLIVSRSPASAELPARDIVTYTRAGNFAGLL